MEQLAAKQQELMGWAEELITAFRGPMDVDAVQKVKILQDTIRTQYERHQFEYRDHLKEKRKDLKLLEEQAREPHEAAFEAAKAELEEQQLRLQDVINDMNSRVEEYMKNRKGLIQELQELASKESAIGKKREQDEEDIRIHVELYRIICPVKWESDDDGTLSGTIYGVESTQKFVFPSERDANVCNRLWERVDDTLGFAW